MKHIGVSTIDIETTMNTYIFMHYPGQVGSFIDLLGILSDNFKL